MKKIILLGVMSFFAQLIVAQYDAEAKKILTKVSNKYATLNAYSVDFVNKLHSPMAGIDEENKGSAIISKEKFKIELDGQLIIADGKTMWTYLKEDNEVNISEFDPEESDMNPSNIYKMWESGYKYRLEEDETINGKKYFVIELNPEDRDNQFFKTKLWVNSTDYTIGKWTMFEKNGNRYSYEITKINTAPTVDANTFKFDKSKYPGVHVEDLR